MRCMAKANGRKADPRNKQISATETPTKEPENRKLLRRTSKKGPMSQQWCHRGDRRHVRRHKRPQQGPTAKPNEALSADWQRKGSENGSNLGAERCQKRVETRDPVEGENRAPAGGSLVHHMKGHPKWSLKTGSLTESIHETCWAAPTAFF